MRRSTVRRRRWWPRRWPRTCLDCGASIEREDYMVHDEIWPLDGNGGRLCVGCLERRIGRRLTAADFTDCPLNTATKFYDGQPVIRSKRLAARLENEGAPG